MLKIEGLSLAVQGRMLLHDIELQIGRGETLALVGASGSGKTTLARLTLGLMPPDGQLSAPTPDTIRLDGVSPFAKGFDRRKTGLIGQALGDALNPHLTVAQHLRETGFPPATLAQRFGIPERLLPRYPAGLSGGEIQRILTALAMAHEPQYLVLDEPSAALDAANRTRLLQLMRGSNRAQLLITHDLDLARHAAQRVLRLEAGRLIPCGRSRPPRPAPPQINRQTGSKIEITGLAHEIDALSLRRGEILVVTGPSGCGKTRLAQLLTGARGPRPKISADRPLRILGLSQYPHLSLPRHFSVAQVLEETRRFAPAPLPPRLLAETGLPQTPEFLARLCPALSGGEAQRLCLARVIAMRPDILVADEPSSALDPANRDRLSDLLRRLAAQDNMTLIVITHDDALARSLGGRQITLTGQRLDIAGKRDHFGIFNLPRPQLRKRRG